MSTHYSGKGAGRAANGYRFAVIGATISGNKGAEAMLRAAIHHLSEAAPDSVFSLLSIYPEEDAAASRSSNIEIVSCKPLQLAFSIIPLCWLHRVFGWLHLPRGIFRRSAAVRALLDADLVVDLAGISFADGRGPIVLYNAAMILPALALGKKLFKASQALGPFQTRLNRALARRYLPQVSRIAARGAITQEHIAELGLSGIEVCADTAFAMPVDPKAAARIDAIYQDPFFARDLIGVSPSTVVEKYCAKRGIDYVAIMAQFVDHAIEEYDANVVLFAHAARQGKPKSRTNDLPTCQRVHERVARRDRCRLLDGVFSAAELRHMIAQNRFFLASRFHAMVSGLAAGVPTLLVGWSHKYVEVLDMFGLSSYQMDYADFSFDRVAENFQRLVENEEGVKSCIAANLPGVLESSRRNWELALGLLED